ncbi:MAG: hypothetical protein PHD82_17260, partial [Candidatus Riflebacteria bacterium]|nr:hypothetical protein [Candidatus Riflebacteria bacterium]
LAGYYEACLQTYPENAEKWQTLKREEEYHAEVFRKIRASAEERPGEWRMGSFLRRRSSWFANRSKTKPMS